MGKFPAVLKRAVLRPLLKKANLTLTLQNYCPVSNLSFLSNSDREMCMSPTGVLQRVIQQYGTPTISL